MSKRLFAAAAIVACLATVVAACGSSQKSSTVAVVRAADTTAQAAGYRLAGTMTISSTRTGPIDIALGGSFNRSARVGQMTAAFNAGGNRLQFSELLSQLTVYLRTDALPTLARATGGKPWVKLDVSREAGAFGLSSLPTATDPSQFVDYLRAVSSKTRSLGTLTVRGVKTSGYQANVDLDRYPTLITPSQQAAVARGVKSLESAIGLHTIPMEVWIDSAGLVRRLGMSFPECAAGTKFQFGMNVDLYDFGPQPTPRLPTANEVYDLTPLVARDLKGAKLSCS
ncbi:MAG: hypothetical protein JO023_00130 [Chloroflexi bacterium]|nr:hypothetical protein [Chloroflexota bacterium]